MIPREKAEKETTKKRLESGFRVLQTVLHFRAITGSPGLGWAVERAVVDRELRELERDMRLHPPLPPFLDLGTPSDMLTDPLPLPYLRPHPGSRPKRYMLPDNEEDPGQLEL
jgi:hypothetical protein